MTRDDFLDPRFGRRGRSSGRSAGTGIAVVSVLLATLSAMVLFGIFAPYAASWRNLHYEHTPYAPDHIALQHGPSDQAVWFLLAGILGVMGAVLWFAGGVMFVMGRRIGRLSLIWLSAGSLVTTVLCGGWAATSGAMPGALLFTLIGVGFWILQLLLVLLPAAREYVAD